MSDVQNGQNGRKYEDAVKESYRAAGVATLPRRNLGPSCDADFMLEDGRPVQCKYQAGAGTIADKIFWWAHAATIYIEAAEVPEAVLYLGGRGWASHTYLVEAIRECYPKIRVELQPTTVV